MNPQDIIKLNNLSEKDKYELLFYYEKYLNVRIVHEKTQSEKDEDILETMDVKNIENYLRKKKLQNLNK